MTPLVETVRARLTDTALDLPATKRALVALFEFIASPVGRTDANCQAVDSFFLLDDGWLSDRLPEAYHDVMAHMDALHDTVSAAEIAKNFGSTPERLLERARNL